MSSSYTASSRSYAWIVLAGAILVLGVTEVLLRLLIVTLDARWPSRVHAVYRAKNPNVIIGDSRLYRGFPANFPFVNLSRAGTSPGALEIVAKEYFRHVEPEKVILEAGPQLFRADMQSAGTQGHERYFGQNRLGLPVLYVFEPGVTLRVSWLLDIPGILEEDRLQRARRQPGNPVDQRKSRRMLTETPQWVRDYTEAVIAVSRPVSGVRESSAFAAYRRMLERLHDAGATICLLTAPTSPLFAEMTAKDVRYIEARLALRELATEFGVRTVDGSDGDLGLDFDAGDFVDTDHLTAAAAEVFAPAAVRACFD